MSRHERYRLGERVTLNERVICNRLMNELPLGSVGRVIAHTGKFPSGIVMVSFSHPDNAGETVTMAVLGSKLARVGKPAPMPIGKRKLKI